MKLHNNSILSNINLSSLAHTIATTQATDNKDIIIIARDDRRMQLLQDAVEFFSSDNTLKKNKVDIITLPAWDCLPYDRVSPASAVSSARVNALCRLTKSKNRKLIITTANAILLKLPPFKVIDAASFIIQTAQQLNRNKIIDFLVNNGYERSSNANYAGEFAVRGSIIDLVPSASESGYRIDFFGDNVESIRIFDPLSQISGKKTEQILLTAASEVIYQKGSIDMFRQKYRELFGAVTTEDPLYEAISQGRRYPGMEHWLPLFYDRLDTVFDYISDNSTIVFDHLAPEAINERFYVILDHYNARCKTDNDSFAGSSSYHPVPVHSLYLPSNELADIVAEHISIKTTAFNEQSENSINLGYKASDNFAALAKTRHIHAFDVMRQFLADNRKNNAKLRKKNQKTIIACVSEGSRERMRKMLSEYEFHTIMMANWQDRTNVSGNSIGLAILAIEEGFLNNDIILLSEQDLLGERINRHISKKKATNFIAEATSMNEGEILVHKEHGIGRFEGLETLTIQSKKHDCLKLLYHGGDKLYIPVENIEILSRYGSNDEDIRLDKLGALAWQARKAALKNRIKIAAEELLKLAAARKLHKADAIEPLTGMYEEFCARFPYSETDDQLRAIEDVTNDLRSGMPMDRLICGDVGYGKTEVALRAAFLAAASGSQVAMIAPTTILARQHYKTFLQRFADMPFNIRQLSRLNNSAENKKVKTELKEGKVDIVIGTHALLAKNIEFQKLGLVIIDEEQLFGVAQKERFKKIRSSVHVLSLSATPIPRTLQMSLAGIKDLSLIATPPIDRLSVRSFIMPYDGVIIRDAILREHYRGGSTFYVAPKIKDLDKLAEKLKKLVPEVKIVKAHGQMPAKELDDIMNRFYDGKYDVLLSTNIVGSGLDVTSANTLIVHRSDMFGLAQLYQLRGRVGRGKTRAYAYFTLLPDKIISKTALQRLEVMQSLDSLGAGFSVASHDMDIRGFGNLLGDEQSGNIREVGIELYQDMLKEAVEKLRDEQNSEDVGAEIASKTDFSPQINLGVSVLIPEAYVADLPLRLALYRRIGELSLEEQVENFAVEMIDRFGAMPEEFDNLLSVIKIKLLCKQAGIEKIDAGEKGMAVYFYNNNFANPEKLLAYIGKNPLRLKLRSDQSVLIKYDEKDGKKRIKLVNEEATKIAQMAAIDICTHKTERKKIAL